MSYATQAAQYRETQVLTASPGRLVVVVFDHLLVCLHRARAAIGSGDITQRGDALHRARMAVGELLATLDTERGGDVAANLSAIYTHMLSELVAAGRDTETTRLDRVLGQVVELRSAFAEIAGEQDGDR